LDALKAVLGALGREQIDAYICLGDIVGYGPQPAECLHEIKQYGCIIVAGNHDYAVAEKLCIDSVNVLAREGVLWTRAKLSAEDIEFLANLPLEDRLEGFHVVHGTLDAPELFDYVQTSYDASLSMARMEAPLCFVGHSHVPVTFVQGDVISYSLRQEIRIRPENKVVLNVGSVGQPRDKDPRACYAVYDTESQTVVIQRAPYDIEAVIGKIREAGLPAPLGERLRVGR